jgi:hypothetical protein
MRNVLLFILAGFVPVAALAQSSSAKPPAPPEVQYDITVQIDPVARRIEGRTVIIANTSEELTLMLRRRFEVMSASVDDFADLPRRQAVSAGWRIAGESTASPHDALEANWPRWIPRLIITRRWAGMNRRAAKQARSCLIPAAGTPISRTSLQVIV